MARVLVPHYCVRRIEKFLGNPRRKDPVSDDLDRSVGIAEVTIHSPKTVWNTNRRGVTFVRVLVSSTPYGDFYNTFIKGNAHNSAYREVREYLESIKDTR